MKSHSSTFLFNKYNSKLVRICNKAIKKNKVDLAADCIQVMARLYYEWNQFYTDEFLEDKISELAQLVIPPIKVNENSMGKKTILFYDGFGYDIRDLALIYLKALAQMNYKVIYLTTSSSIGKQPHIQNIIENSSIVREYFNTADSFKKKVKAIRNICIKYNPQVAFLYTNPDDVSGISVFQQLVGVKRYQINLTDHAFWLGINAFDYCIEFREYGKYISERYRGIASDKLIKLPYYSYVDKRIPLKEVPFDLDKYRIICSGGALYKTMDDNRTFYKIIDTILRKYNDVLFLYIGNGDDTQLQLLKQQYGERVQYLRERDDFFQIMKHAYLFINTYPVSGALMTQYAAMAGLLPVTLLHDDESQLILNNHKTLDIEFDSVNKLYEEIDKLLVDIEYMNRKKRLLANCVISEVKFNDELEKLISDGVTSFCFERDLEFEVSKFQDIYIKTFNKKKCIDIIAQKRLISKFPVESLTKVLNKILNKICGGNK